MIVSGGPQESFTYEVRSRIRENVGVHSRWENTTLSSPIGRLPVYYASIPDVLVNNLGQDPSEWWQQRREFDPDAWHDLEYLAAHCFGGFEERRSQEVFILGMDELGFRLL